MRQVAFKLPTFISPFLYLQGKAHDEVILVSDTFTRADSITTLGAAETRQTWSNTTGAWGINGGWAYPVGTNATQATLEAGTGNCQVSADVKNSAWGNPICGIVIRGIDNNNCLFYIVKDGASRLYKMDGGSSTILATTGFAPLNNIPYNLKVVANENSIKCYRDGTLILNYTLTGDEIDKFGDSRTKVGMYGGGTISVSFDNFKVDAL